LTTAGLRLNAAPGKLPRPELDEVRREVQRVRKLTRGKFDDRLRLIVAEGPEASAPIPADAMKWFRKAMGVESLEPPSTLTVRRASLPDDAARQHRQVRAMEDHARKTLQNSERERNSRFWKKLAGLPSPRFDETLEAFREEFWDHSMGRLPDPVLPGNARTRVWREDPDFTVYEVKLDVWEDVFAWGYLLVPRRLPPGERRPVVVCQHGLEGLPEDVINEDPSSKAFGAYKGFGAALARQGYITFVPHNFYRGKERFRIIQRKLNPLGLTLFSVMIGQHQQILRWLKEQPFVDAERIAFYGLSYGGKSSMRIPAVLPDYCLSICSGDFNEWVRKCASIDLPNSYVFTQEHEIWEWDLGHTFNYAEMAALISPRPFMVERGHNDGVAYDEWVGYEFAKVFRHYQKNGWGGRAQIEYFDGPHTIQGQGTYEFLGRHLRWPPGT